MSLSLVTAAWAAWQAANIPVASARPAREIGAALVKLSIRVPQRARTAQTLGVEREGTGAVIDANGLVLTIGYLLVEAESILVVASDGRVLPGSVAGFDHASGFGLVRTTQPLGGSALALGDTASSPELTTVMIAAHPAAGGISRASVVARRPFTGWWEYALDDAIFTAPARDNHSGAALISVGGQLIGIGSLWVADAIEAGAAFPGNMFVPIDLLTPILGDLKTYGRRRGNRRPWIGVYSEALRGHVIVTQVLSGSPAEGGGLKRGDVILAVGSEAVATQREFYRALWASGIAGASIVLQVWREKSVRQIILRSIDRMDYLRPWSTFAS